MLLMLCLPLTLMAANKKTSVTQVSTTVTLTDDVDYRITSTTPFVDEGLVNIANTEHAVLIFTQVKPSVVISKWLTKVQINGKRAVNNGNCQVKLYNRGTSVKEVAEQVVPESGSELAKDVAVRWKKIVEGLGFTLTGDQRKAIIDIQKDMMTNVPMNRLVQGDVGSGKTAVAILAMAMTALMGKQSVMLAPTSVLARQHYDNACRILKGSGINVVLLLGKTKASVDRGRCIQHFFALRHDLRSYSVSCYNCDPIFLHTASFCSASRL